MLKAILFDVDGTLAETEEFHRRAFNSAFALDGLAIEWSQDQYRDLLKVTGGKERLAAFFRASAMSMPDERIRALHRSKNALYAQGLASGAVGLRPGVRRLMHAARDAGVRLGIATTTSAENLDALLRPLFGTAWADDFASVVAGDQVPRKKPAPDVYLECLRQLQVAAGDAVAIEDSAAGVRAARDAGVGVLATPSQYTDHDDFSQADGVVPHLGDPEHPWERPQAGFARPFVLLEDLGRLGRDWSGAPGSTPAAASFTLP